MIVSAKQDEDEPRHRLLGEGARRLPALALQALGKQRHEGGIEGALAEQAAEQVGKAEGDEEGVRHRPAAQRGGDQDVAKKAEDAAQQRQAADGRKGAVELHGP